MEDLLTKTIGDTKELLSDPKNKQALAIAGIAYYLSKDHKERNAILAGVGALVLLPSANKDDK